MRLVLILGVLCTLGGAVSIAQQPPAPVRFEVASIRPSKSVATYPTVTGRSPGRYAIANATIVNLIVEAYAFRWSSVVGGPDWIHRERYDIVATAPGSSLPQHRLLLQTLLAERFALRVHRETRQLPVYELVKARSNGRLGPNLKPVIADCKGYTDSGASSLRGRCIPWPDVLANAFWNLDRPVIDKAGLSGSFDIDFRWTPLDASDNRPEQVLMFTAVQEQLGLRLQPSLGPVEVLVIDSVERPKPD
jgi:uncharacterized protein (TIGR03435 family)